MVRTRKFRILDTCNLLPQRFHQLRCCRGTTIEVICRLEVAEDKHHSAHILDAVVAVGEVGHGLELLVDDADAGFVGADGDGFDVGGGFGDGFECVVYLGGGFDGSLGVEFGCFLEISWSVIVGI